MFSSHYLKEKHYSNLFLRKAKYGTKVVPLPVQYVPPKLTEGFSLRKNLHIEGAYVLGMVGRINEGKGYHIAIKAFLGLNLENAKLVIVGSANKPSEKTYLESLKKIVSKNGAEERVIFVPHQNNVSVYYKIMDVYLNPVTIDEGFGLSVAEAMAAGVAVISSPYGGLSEFVKSNETAEVVMAKESDAVESLKELILKLKNNEILAKTLSKNARELIESRFNFSQTYIALTDVYQFLDSLD
jgi:glycosyltransferase involved in cell wall biosynthesis